MHLVASHAGDSFPLGKLAAPFPENLQAGCGFIAAPAFAIPHSNLHVVLVTWLDLESLTDRATILYTCLIQHRTPFIQ